jgi:SNF2 family DNA or RNA helicase
MLGIKNLKDWQVEAVDFMTTLNPLLNYKPHKLNAYDPGLGKTPITICSMVETKTKTSLIFCPHAIKDTWAKQLIEWGYCKPDDIHICTTTYEKLPLRKKAIILNYNLIQNKKYDKLYDQLIERDYDTIVCDEAQTLKSTTSNISQSVLGSYGKHKQSLIEQGYWKYFLSGTIAPNRPVELYPLLASCASECMNGHTDYKDYAEYFCDAYWEDGELIAKGAKNIEELHESLKPFMILKKIEDAYPEMPDVLYKNIYTEIDSWEDETNTPSSTLRNKVGFAKVPFVIEYTKEKLKRVPKVIIAAFSTSVIEALYKELKAENFVRVYGKMSKKEKDAAIAKFINDPTCSGLIAQINTVGQGLDGLQFVCNDVISCEPEWSWGLDVQMTGRVRRIGQDKTVFVDRILAIETQDMPMHSQLKNKGRILGQLLRTNTKGVFMSLESVLERIAVALEKQGGSTPVAKTKVSQVVEDEAPAPKKKKAAKDEITKASVNKAVSEALTQLEGQFGDEDIARAKVSKLIKKFGASELKSLSSDKYASFLEALKDYLNEVLTASTDDADEEEEEEEGDDEA